MMLCCGGQLSYSQFGGEVMLCRNGKMEQRSYSQHGRKVMQCCRRKAELEGRRCED